MVKLIGQRVFQRRIALWAALVVLAGCTGGKAPKPADSSAALDGLKTVLEAWKSGKKPEELGAQTPRVHVLDDDWQAGWKLVSFQVSPSSQILGVALQCPVILTLESPEGQSVEKQVIYSVGTDPILSVTRQTDES